VVDRRSDAKLVGTSPDDEVLTRRRLQHNRSGLVGTEARVGKELVMTNPIRLGCRVVRCSEGERTTLTGPSIVEKKVTLAFSGS
jgi:hypothetical protein